MASLKNLIKEYDIKNIVNYLRKSRQDEERERKTGEDTLHEQKKLMDRVLLIMVFHMINGQRLDLVIRLQLAQYSKQL